MSREQAQNIIRDIEKRGFRAYLVGGCVRDTLLSRHPGDWDVTTNALPEETLAVFGDRASPTGLQHGTVTVRMEHQAVAVTASPGMPST